MYWYIYVPFSLSQINVLIDTGSSNFAIAATPDPDIDKFFEREK